MARDRGTALCRRIYAGLLRLYPRAFRERFGEGMAQTFHDLCRERRDAGGNLLMFALWTFGETTAGILRERASMIATRRKRLGRIAVATGGLLLVPLVAMRFSDEVSWNLADFLLAGTLLFGSGLGYELLASRARGTAHRAACGVAIAAALLLVWMNLAVGLIGSEDQPANVMYLAVLAVGGVGAIVARLRPRGMARALFVTAFAQALVPGIALIAWDYHPSAEALVRTLFANTLFVLLFVASAALFRQAGADGRVPRASGEAPRG